jgi:hypothetical protein
MVGLQRVLRPIRHILQSIPHALVSRTTLALFGFLALTSRLPAVVDIYASPVYWVLFTPQYLVSMLLYDGPFGLENLVYPVIGILPVDGHLLWEVGELATFYLFAVAVGLVAERVRRRTRPPPDSATS